MKTLKTLYKYAMTIDGEPFDTYFEDHMLAADFLDEMDREGYITIIHYIKEMNGFDILRDENAYCNSSDRLEYAASILLDNYRDLKTMSSIERELDHKGYLHMNKSYKHTNSELMRNKRYSVSYIEFGCEQFDVWSVKTLRHELKLNEVIITSIQCLDIEQM